VLEKLLSKLQGKHQVLQLLKLSERPLLRPPVKRLVMHPLLALVKKNCRLELQTVMRLPPVKAKLFITP
jgi:hypothetical protein